MFDTFLEERCHSREYINCHIQEIPENGADWVHFKYVHRDFLSKYIWFIKFKWTPVACLPSEPDFDEIMRNHPVDYLRSF